MKRQFLPRGAKKPGGQGHRLRDLARALLTTILVVVFVALVVFLIHLDKIMKDDRIPKNVYLLGEQLGGLTKESAVKRAREVLDAVAARPLYAVFRDQAFRLEPKGAIDLQLESESVIARLLAIGHEGTLLTQVRVRIRLYTGRDRIDLPVRYYYNKDKLRLWADLVAMGINRPPEAAKVVEEGTAKRLVREEPGFGLNAKALAEQIVGGLETLASYRAGAVFIRVDAMKPTIDFEKKAEQLSCRPVAEFTVPLPADPALRERIASGARAFDGLILTGSDKLSVNQQLAGFRDKPFRPRDLPEGFFPDPSGFGPLATALYNAALLGGFEVLERHAHAHAAPAGTWVEPGRDAATDLAAVNLVVRNRKSANSIVAAGVRAGQLTVRIYSSLPLPGEVELQTRDHTPIEPPEKAFLDPSMAAGRRDVIREGIPGLKVATERILKRNGEVVDRTPISKDEYAPVERQIRVGDKH